MADNEKRSNTALFFLLALFALSLGAAVWNFVQVGLNSSRDQEFRGLSSQQALLSQTLVQAADQAVAGDQNAFQQLANARDQFDRSIQLMGEGDPQTLMPAATGEVLSEVQVLQGQWNQVRTALQ